MVASGRLAPPDGPDLAGVLSTARPPRVLSRPGDLLGGAAAVRAGIAASVSGAPPDARALVPALVVGDDRQMSAQVVEDFRTCGLTHLAAVSGTNLTLVVGFLLVLARWVGVRARGLVLVGVLGVLGFVLLARPEPSVLRAAAMGTVALAGMGSRGRDRGVRALGVAVFVLLLLDPWLALSVGFVLSSLATAGILFLGPPFRDALATWLPRWAAEALAVPFAAQLACTPVVAAISGQVSLVAVVANLVVAAAVGPATVLGLLGGVAMLVLPPLGHACGRIAGLCASWIITVAVHLARLPTASVDWSAGVTSVAVLGLLCAAVGLAAARVLRRARWSVALSAVLVVVMLRPLPSPGWPPRGLGPGRLRHRAGRRSGAERRRRQRRGGRHRPGPTGDGPVPRPARGAGAAGGGAHALPRRPRRWAAGGARRSPGGGGRRDGGPGPGRTAPPRCTAGRRPPGCRCGCRRTARYDASVR